MIYNRYTRVKKMFPRDSFRGRVLRKLKHIFLRIKMSDELLKKIINELEGINYSRRLALFLNNEPFLDTWYSELFVGVRRKLLESRKNIALCEYCDTL